MSSVGSLAVAVTASFVVSSVVWGGVAALAPTPEPRRPAIVGSSSSSPIEDHVIKVERDLPSTKRREWSCCTRCGTGDLAIRDGRTGETDARDRTKERVVELGEKDPSIVKLIAWRSFRRFRRSIVLGLLIGAGPAYDFDAGEADFQASPGISVMRFGIPPLPSVKRIVEIARGHAMKVLKERVRAAVSSGESLTEADLDRRARETMDDIKAEFLLELRPRRFEKPSLALRAEVGYLFDAATSR